MQHQSTLSELQFENTIDELIRSNKAQRFGFELSYTDNPQRKKDIHTIIKLLNNGLDQPNEPNEPNKPDQSDQPNKSNIDKNKVVSAKLDKVFDKINDQLLHGKWSKLSIPQKKDRVKLYIESICDDKTQRLEAINLLNNLIDKGKLKEKGKGKVNGVDYDSKSCQILSITQKEYNEYMEEFDNSDEQTNELTNTDSDSDSE